MTSNVVSSGKDSSFLYSPSKVQQYFETCKKIGESFRKSYQEVLGEAGITILALIRTEIQSHTSPRCATSPVAQLYEPSVSSPILPAWEKSSNYCFIYMYHKPID
jgi:hypothetical protein